MSQEYAGRDPLDIAKEAERDLNSTRAQQGDPAYGKGDSSTAQDADPEAGVSQPSQSTFPGSTLQIGSAATGRTIPPDQGGDVVIETAASKESDPADRFTEGSGRGKIEKVRETTDRDFEGEGGPEDKRRLREEERGGDDDIRGNIR